MIDPPPESKLRVTSGGDAGPYIMLPVQEVERVRKLLDSIDTHYWVDESSVSLDGNPPVTVINLAPETNEEVVQRLLDSAV